MKAVNRLPEAPQQARLRPRRALPKAGGYTLRGRESLGLKATLARTVPATTNRRISLPHNPAGVEEWAAGGIRRMWGLGVQRPPGGNLGLIGVFLVRQCGSKRRY